MGYQVTINDLRKLAKQREKAVKDKIRRNADKGVYLVASEFDPLKRGANIDKMSSRDLRSYVKKMNGFTDRKTQFVAGALGEPLPLAKVKQFQALEKSRNATARRHASRFNDVFITTHGMTVGERAAGVEADIFTRLRGGGVSADKPYNEVTRKIGNIANAKGLNVLIEALRRQTKPGYFSKGVEEQRKRHVEFLRSHGNEDQANRIEQLNIDQFDLLMNHTEYQRLNDYHYLVAQEKNERAAARIAAMGETAQGDIDNMIDWASKVG